MKKGTAIFLQIVSVLVGIGVLALLLWEPHLEGRNAHATLFEVYFKDPFLAYVYIASMPFFIGLYQVFKVVGDAGQNKMFSPISAKRVRTIKYCAGITAGSIVAADSFLIIAARSTNEDAAGAVALGIIATVIFIAIATTAALLERIAQKRAVLH